MIIFINIHVKKDFVSLNIHCKLDVVLSMDYYVQKTEKKPENFFVRASSLLSRVSRVLDVENNFCGHFNGILFVRYIMILYAFKKDRKSVI